MKFTVRFATPAYGQYAFTTCASEVGTVLLDEIRKEAGCNLPLKKISGIIGGKAMNPEVEVDEETARRCPHFRHKNTLTVTVCHGALNRFHKTTTMITRDEKEGCILSAKCENQFDAAAAIAAWEAAGFPLVWNDSSDVTPKGTVTYP